MLKFFESIWMMLKTVFRLIVSLIRNAIMLVSMLPRLIDFITSSLVAIPPYALAFVGLCISLIAVYYVIKLIRG